MILLIKFFTILLLLTLNNFLKGNIQFSNHSNLYKNSDYHANYVENKIYKNSGLLHFRTFSDDSLLTDSQISLNFKNSIFNSLSPIHILSPQLYFKNDYFSIFIQSNAVHKKFGYDLLSTRFSRNNFTFEYSVACLSYFNKKSNTKLTIGRSPIWWGQTFHSTLIINPSSGPYDNIYFKQDLNKNFSLEAFSSQLNSKRLNDNIYNRFLSGHKLSYQSNDQKLFFNIGELFLYTGINKSLDIRYLNPVIPYFIVDVNKDEIGADNSNSILFLDTRFNINRGSSFYFELLLDDYQIDDTGVENALGAKLGIDYRIMLFKKKIFFTLEKNTLSNNIYSHSGVHSYFLHNERPIGFQFGQGCNTVNFDVNIQLNENNYFKFSFISLERNRSSNISKWDDLKIDGNDFIETNTLDQKFLFFDLGFISNYKNIFIDSGISNSPLFNYNINGGLKVPNKRFYLGIQYYFNLKTKK